MNEQNIKREKDWHNLLYKDGKNAENSIRSSIVKLHIGAFYVKKRFEKLQNVKNIKVLDIGCGRGTERAKKFFFNNCEYTGIDISENCIKANNEDALKENLNIKYFVEDANKLTSLKNKQFDLVIITATLHHLNIDSSLKAIKSVLKTKGGRVIMFEPMGTNPIINIFRNLTPNMRTPDEHPLLKDDLIKIKSYFRKTYFEFHSLTSLLTIPLGFLKSKKFLTFSQKLSYFLGFLDKYFFCKIPIVKLLSWNIIIEAET